MENALTHDLAVALAFFAFGTGVGELLKESNIFLIRRFGRVIKLATLFCTGGLSLQAATHTFRDASLIPFAHVHGLAQIAVWFMSCLFFLACLEFGGGLKSLDDQSGV